MNVTDQLATLGDTLTANGIQSLKPGLWRVDGGCTVRTGYVMGELTFWCEDGKGRVMPGTYYRGDDLLSFLLSADGILPVKNLGRDFAETLDRRRTTA